MTFKAGDIVCVLIPNAVNSGYDYRLAAPASVGAFVRVSVMNRPYIGVIIGPGTSALPPEKIKPVTEVFSFKITESEIQWIMKMADWTMMTPGAVLKLIVNVPEAFNPPKTEPSFALRATAGKPLRMSLPRQSVADAFASNDNDPMSAFDIQNIARVSAAVVRAMIQKGILEQTSEKIINHKSEIINYYDTGNVTLNAEQSAAAGAIELKNFNVHVLDGVTGSGKTQVYFDAAIKAYLAGKSVLLMMPEIALTAQFMSRFEKRFGAKPVIWHSNLTSARRRDIWRGVAAGEIRIVVGTRSALFLAWQNLGLIVVDEEHDASYKQEDMGNYHARDMAILRAKINDFPIILASATPAAETVKNIQSGNYKCSRLASRFGGATLPAIETVDMRKEKSDGYLSKTLRDAMSQTFAAGRQVMLFINRRGYAPITRCKVCGWTAQCPDCSVGLVYHNKSQKLICHVCGRAQAMPNACPECKNPELSHTGIGVEKIEDEVKSIWPKIRTAIVSSDTIATRQALERLISQMESGQIDCVIGTQILAKGHHFPNLTLVGAVDADMGLFGTDPRAGERTFQQLFQVAGRAGRGVHPGRVLLQTYQPEHPVLKSIVECDRDGAVALDLAARRAAQMPPYGQLIALIVEGKKEKTLQEFCKELAARAPAAAGVKVFGPIPAQIYQVRLWYRMRFLVSGPERTKLQPVINAWLSKIKAPANIKIKIDVNPQNFM
ncbi:MAG: primosomal protein N' [Alphaproteobacteria bacterium]|nr:primosomal protein N' [Alphaproteobacteria bacterium]